jgi:dihydropteroate synthase
VDPEQIIIDPGIGFGKTVEDNLLILKNLQEFKILGKPLLWELSKELYRKDSQRGCNRTVEGTLSSIVVGV